MHHNAIAITTLPQIPYLAGKEGTPKRPFIIALTPLVYRFSSPSVPQHATPVLVTASRRLWSFRMTFVSL